MAVLQFSADGIDTSVFIPDGDYTAIISSSEIRVSRKNDGFLTWTLEVQGGNHHGKKVWDSAMLTGSAAAIETGQRKLARICEALGIRGFSDTTELHNKPMLIRVRINQYGSRNEVVRYMKYESAQHASNAQHVANTLHAPAPHPQSSATKPQVPQFLADRRK